MPYGYSTSTHTPAGYIRGAEAAASRRAAAERARVAELRRILHGYAGASRAEQLRALEELRALGES